MLLPIVRFPCGIYDDEARISMINEHVSTIEKSMKMMQELSKEKDKNYNQLIRWVDNKEKHADYIQHIISQYFLTQRIKPQNRGDAKVYEKYITELSILHKMLTFAMKCKQSTDLSEVDNLRRALAKFKDVYFRVEKMPRKE